MISKFSLLGGGISLLAIFLMSPSVEAAHRICSYSCDVVCLSDANGSGTVSVLPPSPGGDGNFQLWERYRENTDVEDEDGFGTFGIRNVGKGLCLQGGTPTGKEVQGVPCSGTDKSKDKKKNLSQLCKILFENEYGAQLIDMETGYCLSSDGTTAFSEICNSSAGNQFFDGFQVLE
jgi:hypothetical protein